MLLDDWSIVKVLVKNKEMSLETLLKRSCQNTMLTNIQVLSSLNLSLSWIPINHLLMAINFQSKSSDNKKQINQFYSVTPNILAWDVLVNSQIIGQDFSLTYTV